VVLTCRNVAQLQDRHLDGELSASLSAEVHAHLLQCPACQRQHELYRTVGEVVGRDRSEPLLSADFASRVVAEFVANPPRSGSTVLNIQTRRALRERFWRLAFSVSVPAAAAMLFLGVLIWPTTDVRGPRGLVAGVSVRATDAAGVNDVAAPAMNVVAETVRAAKSFSQMQQILVDEAKPAFVPTVDPEVTLLNALFIPFTEALEPARPVEAKDADEGIIRF